MTTLKIAVAGAGFSGAVIAQQLASAGYQVDVFESRSHVAGNCHTDRDERTGVLVHRYGPHIFHTDKQHVWDFITQFTEFKPYTHRVKAVSGGKLYSLPVNLLTINQFFEKVMGPDEARSFIQEQADKSIEEPQNFEEQALSTIGRELYDAFFRGYTLKQWGRDPKSLPASILKRLPLRFNYDDRYFASSHQYGGIPTDGYTPIVHRMLQHENIQVHLSTPYTEDLAENYDHLFYTGPLDAYYQHRLGRLAYRTLDFEAFYHPGDYQGCPVVNECDPDVPYTRITEHKHFAPWEEHEASICFKEYSREAEAGDIPYYPVRLTDDKELLESYLELAAAEDQVTFVGRLATYQYLDMDRAIDLALQAAAEFLKKHATSLVDL